MKRMFPLIPAIFAAASLVGCGDSSSSSDSNGVEENFDCNLASDGVKVFAPKGGEVFRLGDSVEIVFVAKYKNAGGFKVYYKADEEDSGTNLFSTSIGEEAPNGTSCTTVSAYLDPENVKPSDKAFIRVEAYNSGKIRGNSETFTVKE